MRTGWLPPPEPGTVALVTGASSGIGAELARGLARRGHALVLVARRRDRLEALATECARAGVSARAVACDLTVPAERERLADAVAGETVSVLVNAAGAGLAGHVAVVPVADQLAVVRLDLEAVVDLCARYVPPMVERGRGAVLNVGSLSSFAPSPAMASYAACKAAVLSFSEALHTEVRPHGIAVTAACPGFVRTDFIEAAHLTEVAAGAPSWIFDSPGAVAEHALRALDRNRRVTVHRLPYRSAAAALRHLPHGVVLTALDRWSPFRRDGAAAAGMPADSATRGPPTLRRPVGRPGSWQR